MGSFTTFIKERFWHIVLILAVVYFMVLIRNDTVQNNELKDEKAMTARSLAEENAKQSALKKELRSLGKDSQIEMLAREKLGVVRQGEKAYKVIIK